MARTRDATEDLLARAAALAADRWREDGESWSAFTLDGGDRRAHLHAPRATAELLLATLAALPAEIRRLHGELAPLRAEVARLRDEIATLERRARAAERGAAAGAGRARGGRRSDGAEHPHGDGGRGRTAFADVPLAMIAPVRPDARLAAAAKDDPLLALALQAAKALQPDASPLERARLAAMANAASRRDLKSFWEARNQRSVRVLAGRR